MTFGDELFEDEVSGVVDVDVREERRAKQEELEKQYRAQLQADAMQVMSTHSGRRFVWDLLAPMWRSSYFGSREDTDFREGERNVALKIWGTLKAACPNLARKMQEENDNVL